MDSLMDGWMYLLGSTVMLFATCPDMSDLLLLQPFPLCVYIIIIKLGVRFIPQLQRLQFSQKTSRVEMDGRIEFI